MTRRCAIVTLAGARLAAGTGHAALAEPAAVTKLEGDTHHVQGIDIAGQRLWVTSVDVRAKKGLLLEYSLPDGKLIRSVTLMDGERYHPGGLSGDASSLWIPVAEYRRSSTSVIQRRSRATLELEGQFPVADHIGCVAVTDAEVIGGNWDAREIYVWSRDGALVRKVPNPTNNAFQDLKFAGGRLVGGGLLPDKSGAIDFLEYPGLRPVQRVLAGRTDRGVVYTHEGMAIEGDRLWLLPEDAPSRLFAFTLPK